MLQGRQHSNTRYRILLLIFRYLESKVVKISEITRSTRKSVVLLCKTTDFLVDLVISDIYFNRCRFRSCSIQRRLNSAFQNRLHRHHRRHKRHNKHSNTRNKYYTSIRFIPRRTGLGSQRRWQINKSEVTEDRHRNRCNALSNDESYDPCRKGVT